MINILKFAGSKKNRGLDKYGDCINGTRCDVIATVYKLSDGEILPPANMKLKYMY